MGKVKGTNSILLLYLRSVWRIKWSWFNFLTPMIGSTILTPIFFFFINLKPADFTTLVLNLVGTSLGFNGVVLGFVIATYTIFAGSGDKEFIIFSITNKKSDDYYSFHKSKLLIFFKSFFWLFVTCVIDFILITLYSLSGKISGFGYTLTLADATQAILLFSFFYSQIKVLIELKVSIFTVYNTSLTQAKFLAQAQGKLPIDDSND